MKTDFLKNEIDISEFKPEYNIIDVECIKGFFSLQFRNEKMPLAQEFECIKDDDFYDLYHNILKNTKRPMYAYSLDYDAVMLNALCKMVEKKKENINQLLKEFNDFLIYKHINYYILNRSFWCDCYFKLKDHGNENLWESTIKRFKSIHQDENVHEFVDKFDYVFGKSSVMKNIVVNSIPKIMYYYNINQDRTLRMNISLKKLQLVKEGYNIKWDFDFSSDWNEMTKEEKDEFRKYSLNDVDFLFRFFENHCLPDIKKRFYAYKACKTIDGTVSLSNKVLYTENNTDLIVNLLKLDSPITMCDDFQLDFTKYIHTPSEKFNTFVKFVEDHQNNKLDGDLKQLYCETYEKEYIKDDYNILSPDGFRGDLQVNSFDEIEIKGLKMKTGFGGLHGAIDNYIDTDLQHLDYTSQYPSIILQNEKLFETIINIPRYKAIYKLRNVTLKDDLKTLKSLTTKNTKDIEEIEDMISGTKLFLNSAYGLINSNFDIPISNKNLGRFICLTGQSLLINLIYKFDDETILGNVNTDGIIAKTNQDIKLLCSEVENGFYKLGVTKIEKIIQKDVNNYIKFVDGKLKTKGCFNIKIKQLINKNEKLACNLKNALKLLEGKNVEIQPIYFDAKWFDVPEKPYYFATSKHGKQFIKKTVKPEIIGMDNEPYYFTDDIVAADLTLYEKYADITKNRIFDFQLEKKEIIKYLEIILEKDTPDNIKIKGNVKRALGKLFKNQIGLVGFKGDPKANVVNWVSPNKNAIIKPLIHYTMTQIKESTMCNGFSVHDYLIIDVDIYDHKKGKAKPGWEIVKPYIGWLKTLNTFECWNNKTEHYNRKFIFEPCESYILPEEYKGYIEIIKKATVWSLENSDLVYYNNGLPPKEFIK
jgi:hypothetical protein